MNAARFNIALNRPDAQMARKRYPLAPIDRNGNTIGAGDFVRLIQIPNLKGLPPATKAVFRQALGRRFRVDGFERNGLAELNIARFETICVEPEFLSLLRRSARFTARRRDRVRTAVRRRTG